VAKVELAVSIDIAFKVVATLLPFFNEVKLQVFEFKELHHV